MPVGCGAARSDLDLRLVCRVALWLAFLGWRDPRRLVQGVFVVTFFAESCAVAVLQAPAWTRLVWVFEKTGALGPAERGVMELMTLTTFAIAVPAVLTAGISKGGFGSGAAFAGAVLLALAVEPQVALAIMLPLLMVMDVTALPAYWRKWDGVAARALCLGAVPGVILAALVFRRADAETLRVLIGVVALGFVAFQLARQSGVLRIKGLPSGRGAGLAWGSVAGFTSFVSHAGGPPAAVYMLSRGLSKQTYQATSVITFWAINMMKIGPYAWLGAFSAETLWLVASLIPVAVAGILLGVWLHNRVATVWYFRVTYILLTLTGAKLVWDGLT